jgi:riboflavin kinase/FMN adenylyltransferase
MLGRPYALAGTVIPGDQRGRQMGFPTANLDIAGLVLPPAGVYAARARWADRTADAVINVGQRPTIDPANRTVGVEAHLLDTQADLYGVELELTLGARLRDEQVFASVDALRAQIHGDVAGARAALSTPPV